MNNLILKLKIYWLRHKLVRQQQAIKETRSKLRYGHLIAMKYPIYQNQYLEHVQTRRELERLTYGEES